MRRGISTVAAIGVTGLLLVTTQVTGQTSSAYTFDWIGTPASPQLWSGAGGWDVQIHNRAPGNGMDPMDAQHGADCAAPPATHPINTLAQGVFICKNHLMTAITDQGYGEIALTPDHMADWSTGTTVIQTSVSTLQLANSDFIELWITPFADNQTLPFEEVDPDLQGPPKNGIRFSMNHDGPIKGTYEGNVAEYVNFSETTLPMARNDLLVNLVPPSAATRTIYEVDISQGHIRFGLPALNVWWTDTNTTVPFTRGVVQLVHHSYNAAKHNPGAGIDTFHWSNFSISNAVPFTIINGVERSLQSGATTLHFPAASPSGSFLRFSGIGTIQVSYDGGATWQAAQRQSQVGNKPEHFSSYFSPMPTGVSTVLFQGTNWYGGPWWVRDPAIWSLSTATPPPPSPSPSATASPSPSPSPSASPSPTPSPSPSPLPSPSPSPSPSPQPTPMPISNMPCTVMFNGVPTTGTCSGTFIHS